MNGGRVWANVHEVQIIYATITAAADVAASGYTVTKGGDFISAVTRTAEGDAKIALRKAFPGFLSARMISTRADSKLTFDNVTNIGSATDPHIDVTFTEGGSDTDPDGATMYMAIEVYKTSVR